jgi:AbrB-like transcriptional regulator
MKESVPTALTGRVLLAKVKELSNLSRRETAKQCGYYTESKGGQVRVNLTEFYDAVLLAKGVPVGPESSKDGRGRDATYEVTVHQNGQIVIGAAYTKKMGLKQGDEFKIRLGYKHIYLEAINKDDDDE